MAPIRFVTSMAGAMLTLASMATPWSDIHSTLTAPDIHQSAKPPNVSVGFSFHPSFVTGTLLFEHADGELEWHTEIDRHSDEYQEVMARLSLPSSRHLAPPYVDDGEAWSDLPRKLYRESLKKIGLPASHDVGVLAHAIKRVRTKLEKTHDVLIDDAVFAASHLTALYQDDMEDVAAHLNIHYFVPDLQFRPFVWESASAYAGYGFGLCEHWRDRERCSKETKEAEMIPVLSVHFSRNALTASWPYIHAAIMTIEPEGRHFEDFTLGSDAITRYPTHDDYWAAVREFLLLIIRVNPGALSPRRIMVQGDMVDEHFLQVVREVIASHWGEDEVAPIYTHLAVSASSRGAAEFMRRGPAPWASNNGGEVEL